MKTTARTALTLVATLALLPACAPADDVTIGEPAPAFTLTDLDGDTHSLEDYRGQVVVLEWINPNCPYSLRHAEEGTMTEIVDDNPDIAFLAVNSTAESHGNYETPSEHQAYNEEHGIDYPVLYDTDGSVGTAYGAKTTPHMFVIDESGDVIYDGAIDDDPYANEDERTNHVREALAAHEAGGTPDPATTKPYGCSIKYAD